MGFKKLFKAPQAATPAAVKVDPPTVTETQENDTLADYAQRASRRRGLLSTILTNRNRTAALESSSGGNKTLG